ncbi:MAG: PSD1 and planctomycete cytochrome C domain-containing protein [Pirellulaceae bacterium]
MIDPVRNSANEMYDVRRTSGSRVMRHLLVVLFWLAAAWGGNVQAEEKAETEAAQKQQAERHFTLNVLPLLKSKCFACHGEKADDVKGELNMLSRAGLLEGGESGEAALVPGKPDEGLLMAAVRWDGIEMPPKENDRLTETQIKVLQKWIADGAPWPDAAAQRRHLADEWSRSETNDGVIVPTSGGLADEWTYRRYQVDDLWAYRPITRPDAPWSALPDDAARHPIDAFLQDRLNQAGLKPAPPADRAVLLRRLTYDLTGLPPTPKQTEAFLADDSPRAYENLIDRLLESPRYGEQWARHWLDVTRYGDTSGFSRDDPRPNAWRYRDYVIRAFNDDKPFDRFIAEQIAGDELDENDPELLIAAGYLRMGPWEHTGMSVAAVTRQQYLDDATNALGETFLGQVLRCAKCHDHKFDPLPTRDYYRLMASLAPVQLAERSVPFLPQENTTGFDGRRERFQRLLDEAQQAQAAIGRKEQLAQRKWLEDRGVEIGQGGVAATVRKLPQDERPPRFYGLDYTDLGVQKVLRKRIEYLQQMLLTFEPYALSVYSGPYRQYSSNKAMMPMPEKMTGEVETVSILMGGSIESPGEPVTPGVLSAAAYPLRDLHQDGWGELPESTTGRRLELARWIASEQNPFTARVIVNRIWQHHFGGRGIVATPNNFGVTGKRPTHPALLDFLAAWFMDNGWSIKKLHRLILTSAAYQRSGDHADMAALREADPTNELLAVYPPRRLTAEEIRDSMLLLSGELDLTMGGPGVFPEINREVALQPIHVMGSVAPAWQPSPTPGERNRRSIYVYRQRNRSYPLLEVFNRPGSETSCERRDETTVTPQAFALLNSQNTYDRALAAAARIQQQAKPKSDQIDAAFRLALGRAPTENERKLCLDHYEQMLAHHREQKPKPISPPTEVLRNMVEEMTGESFEWTEPLDIYAGGTYVADLKPWAVEPETRALAEVCLVLMNSNEFVYVY